MAQPSAPIALQAPASTGTEPNPKKRKIDSSADPRATEVFKKAKTSHPNDSDDELPPMDRRVTVFSKKEPTQVEAMTIPCRDKEGKPKNIKGSQLIEMVHDEIHRWYVEAIELACEYERDIGCAMLTPPSVQQGDVITILHRKDWVMSIGGWKGMAPSGEMRDYFFSLTKGRKFAGAAIFNNGLTFPIQNHRIHIPKGFLIHKFDVTTAWEKTDKGFAQVPEGRTDLSYAQIVQAIKYIKKTFGLNDAALATIQLVAFIREGELPKGVWQKTPKENQKEIEQFLDYLNALMFGIEASGLNAALMIGFMTLDLIVDGKLDYQTAFKANEDGGVYPYACFGNNQGSYNAREKIILHAMENRSPLSMKEFREAPTLSPVANKEAMLIKTWLACNDVVAPNGDYDEQVDRVERAIRDLFTHYFVPGSRPSQDQGQDFSKNLPSKPVLAKT